MNISFITWYPSCRRSDALAKSLGGVSHLIHYFEFKQPRYAPFKYVLQTLTTFRRLRRDKPRLIFVASPPVVAVFAVWLYSRLFGVPYIIDAHSGIFDDPRWTWLLPVSRFLSRSALATVVTNSFLAHRVRDWGAHATIVGDVPVTLEAVVRRDLGPGFHVVVINTFSQDEPLDEIIEAAWNVPEVRFHITGNQNHSRNNWNGTLPVNARFTGWLSDKDYGSLLLSADVVMCLTTHDHTMQRGAYEAVALEKPLITSNWSLLRETFSRGTIHVANTPEDIAHAVRLSRTRHTELAAEMRRLRCERLAVFNQVKVEFERHLREVRT